jgi:NIMA (never in mitosis gene a)-related kinase
MIENRIFYLILEYCEQGDLDNHISFCLKNEENFPEVLIAFWSLQILKAIRFLHSQAIVHRDIKAKNVFLTKEGNIKLGDFGVSRVMKPEEKVASTYTGTVTNISPEILRDRKHDYKTDIWSMGDLRCFVLIVRNSYVSTLRIEIPL